MNQQQQFIKEKAISYAKNIAEFSIGDVLITSLGNYAIITNKTINSIQVYIKNRLNKNGISYNDWYDMDSFNKRFKKLNNSR